jgi:hypothetical protein
MGHTLKFNPAAVKLLSGNTRVRLLTKSRGGEVFVALRPSYRVAGKNVQLLVDAVEGEKHQLADMPKAVMALIEGLPELKNNTHYHMEDIGYQWFILKASDTDIDDKKPGIYVSRLREKPVKKDETPAADAQAADNGAPAEQAETETPVAGDPPAEPGETPSEAPDEVKAEIPGEKAEADEHAPAGTTIAETEAVLVATAETTGDAESNTEANTGETAPEAAADPEPAEEAAASAKPKRVRPSRAKAKVDAKAE